MMCMPLAQSCRLPPSVDNTITCGAANLKRSVAAVTPTLFTLVPTSITDLRF